ncbi:MAG: WD40 repeat domain-containing protein [Bacteroidota bacterium]|nr:WD40 repeat domain-containing protein [Bacteroidota bacterium]
MNQIQIKRLHALTGHRDAVYTICRGPEPSRFFSAAGDGMIALWDLSSPESGELIAKLPNSIYALHYFELADLLIVGHNYEGIHLLDWKTKKESGSLKLSAAAIFDLQSIDNRLVVGSGDGVVTLVDLRNLTILKKVKGGEKSARTIAINREREEIAIGFSDNFIRVYDLDLTLKQEWQAHTKSVFTLRYSPDGQWLLSGSRDARLKAWSLDANYQLAEEVVAHMYAINHIQFSPDGKHFVTCSMDKSIKVWDAKALKLLKVIDRARHAGHATSVNKLLWTDYDNQLLSASDDRSISVWQIIF